MQTTVKTRGFKNAERALLALSNTEAKKLARAALRKQARRVANAAKDAVPVDQGRLRRAISVRVDILRDETGRRGSLMSAVVYISDKQGPRLRKTEQQSTVRGKKGPARSKYQIGSYPSVYGRFREFGIHGPVQAFFRPAWDSQGGGTAVNMIGHELAEGFKSFAASAKGR